MGFKVWYIPILADNTIPKGSDNAYASNYVRPDCVRDHIKAIAKVSKAKEIYAFTDKQFWDYPIWDPVVVRKVGRKVYEASEHVQENS